MLRARFGVRYCCTRSKREATCTERDDIRLAMYVSEKRGQFAGDVGDTEREVRKREREDHRLDVRCEEERVRDRRRERAKERKV